MIVLCWTQSVSNFVFLLSSISIPNPGTSATIFKVLRFNGNSQISKISTYSKKGSLLGSSAFSALVFKSSFLAGSTPVLVLFLEPFGLPLFLGGGRSSLLFSGALLVAFALEHPLFFYLVYQDPLVAVNDITYFQIMNILLNRYFLENS